MLDITTEISDSKPSQGTTAKRKYSLKQHLLEKMKTGSTAYWKESATSFWAAIGTRGWTKVMTTTGTDIGRAESTFSVWEKSS